MKYKLACAKLCEMQQELYTNNRTLQDMEWHCVHGRDKSVERQSDSVTQEVADAVCGEVRTMLLEHLHSWEFVLPDGNLCDPPRTALALWSPSDCQGD